MKNTCVSICSYHRTLSEECDGNKVIRKFASQGFENFRVLFDNQTGKSESEVENGYQSKVCLYNGLDFEENSFNRPINKHHRWGSHQNPNYFYAHFRMLIFFLKNPGFEYYWFFDDDVNFDGSLKDMLMAYEGLHDDFLAIQAFKKEDYKEIPRISVINNRMEGSRGFWLGHCPGAGDNFKSFERHIGCFFPIARFSNRAMIHLLELNKSGYYGYSEGFVPTSLASEGFKVASMMDEFNNYFVNNNTDCILYHKGAKFTWEWL
jgi:hypothetical protein